MEVSNGPWSFPYLSSQQARTKLQKDQNEVRLQLQQVCVASVFLSPAMFHVVFFAEANGQSCPSTWAPRKHQEEVERAEGGGQRSTVEKVNNTLR